ncbi:MAG: glycine--tRNA ligase subunit beta, partial [Pseudomonadota bacterium]
AIDEKPTGSKDPYALRRAALGVVRLILENSLTLGLLATVHSGLRKNIADDDIANSASELTKEIAELQAKSAEYFQEASSVAKGASQAALMQAVKGFDDEVTQKQKILRRVALQIENIAEAETKLPSDLLSFFHERLKVYLRDRGIRHDIIDASIAMPSNDDLTLLVKRAEALSETLKTDDGENLIQGFKRANNILTQAEDKDGVEYSFGADVKFADHDAERALFAALDTADEAIKPAMTAEDFATAMTAMATLRGPIDAFFEAVKINADSDLIRRNRLNLLHRIRTTCLSVADLTKIEG